MELFAASDGNSRNGCFGVLGTAAVGAELGVVINLLTAIGTEFHFRHSFCLQYTEMGYSDYTSLVLFSQGVVRIFRLKELRKKKRISQVMLAMDLNINQNSISRYETGEREADYATLIAIADYFNVSIDYLLGRTENPKMNE